MEKRKRIAAIGLTACLILAAIPIASMARTYVNDTDPEESVVEATLLNEDFEAGADGEEPEGWKLVPFEYASTPSEPGKNLEWATTNHTVKTKLLEDGNKVAQLNRVNGGYAGLGSQPIEVTGGQVYQFSLDYRTVDVHDAPNAAPNTTTFYGINLAVQQLNEAGEEVAFDSFRVGAQGYGTGEYGYGRTVSDQWYMLTQSIGMRPDAATAVMYIVIRGQWNARAEMWLDNVCVRKCEKDEVWNGDFEIDGVQQDRGVAGWKLVSCMNDSGDPEPTNPNHWTGNFSLSAVKEDENSYLKFAPNNKVTGYAMAQSSLIPVSGKQDYVVSYDFKEENTNINYGSVKPKIIVYYYGSDGVYQSAKTLKTLEYNLTEWTRIVCEGTVPEGAAFMTVNFYIGGERGGGTDINYFDNVKVSVNDGTQIFNGSGEYGRTESTASKWTVPGWTMQGTNRQGVLEGSDSTNKWETHYTVTVAEDADKDGIGGAFRIEHEYYYGYAAFVSSKVNIVPEESYELSYWYKMTDFKSAAAGGPKILPLNPTVVQYDAKGKQLKETTFGINTNTGSGTEVKEWTEFSNTFTADKDAAFCEIYIKMGSDSLQTSYIIWLDGITLTKGLEKPTWSEETTMYDGSPRPENDFTASYDLVAKHIKGRGDVLKLYVTRAEGCLGAVTYFSEPLEVTGDTVYETSYDLKIEGIDVPDHDAGAVFVLRYLDAEKQKLAQVSIFSETNSPKNNQDWTHYSKKVSTPESAAYVQIGLLIGDSKMNRLKDMAYYYDNIQFVPTDSDLPDGEEFRCTMLGASIRNDDIGRIHFMAQAPKGNPAYGTTIKEMGILVIPAGYLAEGDPEYKSDAAMKLDNKYVEKLAVDEIAGSGEEFYANLNVEDMDPEEIYRAVAYVVYEKDGLTRTLYSDNQYQNEYGIVTATNGISENSVYGLARNIAQAIGQKTQKPLDLEKMSGADIYKYVCENYRLLTAGN